MNRAVNIGFNLVRKGSRFSRESREFRGEVINRAAKPFGKLHRRGEAHRPTAQEQLIHHAGCADTITLTELPLGDF